MLLQLLFLIPFLIGGSVALPAAKRAAPSIQLDDGTFVGSSDGTVDKFLGIPFAKPPCASPFEYYSYRPQLTFYIYAFVGRGTCASTSPLQWTHITARRL